MLPAHMNDTETVTLKVCDRSGLQQVTWASRSFGLADAAKKFWDIYTEGAQQHGEADRGDLDRGTAGWSKEGIGMRLERHPQEGYRVIMISDGPLLKQCLAEHQQITGNR